MGDRGEVIINGVHLYTHWGAAGLIQTVKSALSRNERWNDISYLTRIIFCEMVKGNIDGSTGYGISTGSSDAWRVISLLNGKNNEIIVKDYDEEVFSGSFQEFLDWEGVECGN